MRLYEHLAGGAGEGDAEPKLPYPPVAGNAPRFAEGVVATTRDVDGIHLDYSTGSLDEVERILGTYHDDGLDPDRVAGTVFALGCYIGEVIVRHAGGTWQDLDPATSQALNTPIGVQLPDGRIADPVGQAFRRVQDGPASAIPTFAAALLPD